MISDSMLIVLPVPFRQTGGETLIEQQAANGLDRWAENFSRIFVAAPVIPESMASSSAAGWTASHLLTHSSRVEIIPLPWAYRLPDFLRTYKDTQRLLASFIDQAEFLQFAIGWTVGDWAAVGALTAIHKRRSYAIHTDRVEHQVVSEVARRAALPKRAKVWFEAHAAKAYHRYLINRCSLGLWHGKNCFDVYGRWCSNNHLIHDVHTKAEDAINPFELARKMDCVEREETLRICYAGRLDPMKAPLDWVRAVAHAQRQGALIKAVWYGDGSLRSEVEAQVREENAQGFITVAGFVEDRRKLLASIRESHLMVFTHVTPESPRCLLESLQSGTPIVGYSGEFARDLVKDTGGGSFVAIHDWRALGDRIYHLSQNRSELAALVSRAAVTGREFNDAAVFTSRSRLLRQFAGVRPIELASQECRA